MKTRKMLAGLLIAAGVCCFNFAVYGQEKETGMPEKVFVDAAVEVKDEVETDSGLPQEGETLEGDDYASVVDWFEYDGNRIFGRFYYPENFDETKQYTTVLLCHGGNITSDFWDAVYAPALTKQGYICYAFDCRSGTGDSVAERVTYSDPTESGTADVMTYAEDMNAAMSFVKSKGYIDTENLYLMGQSQGGMTAQIVAAQRSEEVAGVVVLYGSATDNYRNSIENYEALEAHPYHHGEVLFIQGTEDNFRTEQDTIENMEWYEKSSFVLISDAYHGFGNGPGRPAEISIGSVLDFISRTGNDETMEG